MHFNSADFCETILPQLADFAFPNGKNKHERNWIQHFENAPLQISSVWLSSSFGADFYNSKEKYDK